MNNIMNDLIKIELTEDEAYLFRAFQKHYVILARLTGYMESMNLFDLKNSSITLDIDPNGVINHTSITRHYK